MMSNKRKLISVVVASIFAVSFGAAPTVIAAELSPTVAQLSNKNLILASADGHDGKSGGHEGKKSKKSCEKHMNGQGDGKMMSKADADGDGKISRVEFMRHHGAMFDKHDANKDGFMDKEEMRGMMKPMPGQDDHDHDHGADDKAHDH